MTAAAATSTREVRDNSVTYILDDDKEVCALVTRMVQATGFIALPFTDPTLCLRQLKTCDAYSIPKTIILDLSLGKTDGIEFLNELKTLKYKGSVLLISGKAESALLEVEGMGVSRGISMLPPLKKPFRLDDLAKRLKLKLDPVKQSPKESPFNSPTAALERAVSSRGLICRYQMRLDLKTASACGAEVVLYERNPSSGLMPLTISSVPPDAPILHPLSRLLIRTVLEDWRLHLTELSSPFRLFTKLPLSVVTTAGFITLVREAFSQHPQFPGLVIEVNDWNHFNDARTVREASAQLKLYGIGLAIDDIGAVYHSVMESYKFPFDEFKLHSKLVSNLALNETKQTLCGDAIKLVHSTGASVCADGIVNADELRTLVEMKCDSGQGSLFGEPQPIETFRAKILAPTPSQGMDPNSSIASFEWPT